LRSYSPACRASPAWDGAYLQDVNLTPQRMRAVTPPIDMPTPEPHDDEWLSRANTVRRSGNVGMQQLKAENDGLRQQITALQAKAAKGELDATRVLPTAMKQQEETLRKEFEGKVVAQQQQIETQRKLLEAQGNPSAELQAERARCQDALSKLEAARKQFEEDRRSWEGERQAAASTCRQHEEARRRWDGERQALEASTRKLEEDRRRLETDKHVHEQDRLRWVAERRTMDQEKGRLGAEATAAEARVAREEQEKGALTQRVAELQAQLQAKAQAVAGDQCQWCRSMEADLRMEQRRRQTEKDESLATITALEKSERALRHEVVELHDQLALLRAPDQGEAHAEELQAVRDHLSSAQARAAAAEARAIAAEASCRARSDASGGVEALKLTMSKRLSRAHCRQLQRRVLLQWVRAVTSTGSAEIRHQFILRYCTERLVRKLMQFWLYFAKEQRLEFDQQVNMFEDDRAMQLQKLLDEEKRSRSNLQGQLQHMAMQVQQAQQQSMVPMAEISVQRNRAAEAELRAQEAQRKYQAEVDRAARKDTELTTVMQEKDELLACRRHLEDELQRAEAARVEAEEKLAARRDEPATARSGNGQLDASRGSNVDRALSLSQRSLTSRSARGEPPVYCGLFGPR